MDVQVEITRYDVSCLPQGNINRSAFLITVERRGPDSWAVMYLSQCIGRRGQRSYEGLPSSRTERFLKAYRFDLETALAIAKREAPKLTVNGHTVQEVLAREAPRS